MSSNITEEYLVFKKPLKVERVKLFVEVAYKLAQKQNGKEIIAPECNSNLIVISPAGTVTNLNFLIQGPFRITPNRKTIP